MVTTTIFPPGRLEQLDALCCVLLFLPLSLRITWTGSNCSGHYLGLVRLLKNIRRNEARSCGAGRGAFSGLCTHVFQGQHTHAHSALPPKPLPTPLPPYRPGVAGGLLLSYTGILPLSFPSLLGVLSQVILLSVPMLPRFFCFFFTVPHCTPQWTIV